MRVGAHRGRAYDGAVSRPQPRRAPALGALVAIVLALLWPLAPPRAAAAEGPAVALTAASLIGSGPDAVLVLTATVANTTGDPLHDVQLQLWRSTAVLRSAAALTRTLAAEEPPSGTSQAVEPSNTAALTAPDASLPFGTEVSGSVSGTLGGLGLTRTGASYWVGVRVTARAAPDAPSGEVAIARTLVTVPDAGAEVSLTSVVDLSAPPRQVKGDLFVDDGLADDLEGRLRVLLDAARSRDWVVDPALLAEVRDMADGYRVRTAPGVSEEGTHADLAQAWLGDYDQLDPDRGHAGLFATPDAARAEVVAAATAAGEAVPDVDLPVAAVLDAPAATTLAALSDQGRPVLATGLDADAAPVDVGGTTVVPALAPTDLTLPASLADEPLARTAVLTALARADGRQVRVLRSAEDVAIDAATPDWVRRTDLATLLATTPPDQTLGAADPTTGLDEATLLRVEDLMAGIQAYAEAAPEADLAGLPEDVLARAASRWFADDPAGRDAYLDAVDTRAGFWALDAGLELSASARFSLAGSSGDYPVTVTNHLVDPVVVRVVATTDNPQRIRFVPAEATRVEPGSSTALLLRAEASGGGVVEARIHVESLAGRRLTADEAIVVETTNFGLIGWVLVIGSAVVLVTTTALRIHRVRAATRAQKAGEHG